MSRYNNSAITLTKEQKTTAARKLEGYMLENFEVEIGGLQAGILCDYIAVHIGPYIYNLAVADIISHLTDRTEEMYLLMKDAPR
jgi:uncharacterized protein (DUF2164 family)